MTQFTCKGVKQINNRISLNCISRRFSSAREFQMGEFPEIFIAKCRPPLCGSLPRKSLISRMDWVSCMGDINLPDTPFPPARSPPTKKLFTFFSRHICLQSIGYFRQGDKAFTREPPAQRRRINRYALYVQ
jgi:hypothetical protein